MLGALRIDMAEGGPPQPGDTNLRAEGEGRADGDADHPEADEVEARHQLLPPHPPEDPSNRSL